MVHCATVLRHSAAWLLPSLHDMTTMRTEHERPAVVSPAAAMVGSERHERGSEAGPERRAFRNAVLAALGVFVVTRLCMAAAAAVRAAQITVDARAAGDDPTAGPAGLMLGVLSSWDGEWYMEIVRTGYPGYVPPDITFFQLEARVAFFPVFPLVVRVATRIVHVVAPGVGDVYMALLINTVMAVVAIVLIGLLAKRLYGLETAKRAMVLFAIFPGSFVLSYTYAEPIFFVVALACMLMLLDERWALAGAFAAIGTATRPNGVALVAACAVASFFAIRSRRDWSSLVAPLLAPIGLVAFHLYLGFQTGEWGVWFRVQSEAWEEGTSFGATAVTNTLEFIGNPFGSPTDAVTALSFVCMLAGLWCMWRKPLPASMVAYIVVILALMLIPATVTARPRFIYTAFPLLIAVAAWWPRRDRYGWELFTLVCGAGLVGLTGLYAVYGVIP